MTTCTPIYGLEYQTGSDRPCDAPEVWCNFAQSVEDQLDIIDTSMSTSIVTVPQFAVSVAGGFTLSPADLVPFDTVLADTANIVDLSSNKYTFRLPMAGRWFLYYQASISYASFLVAFTLRIGNFPALSTSESFYTSEVDYSTTNTANPIFAGTGQMVYYPDDATSIGLNVGTTDPANVNFSAILGGFWMGDL